MTTPKINTIKRGGARLYVHPTTGQKAVGVTSVLNNLPKPFLQYWRAKVVAEFAVDNAGTLTQMLLDGAAEGRDPLLARKATVDWLKNAPQRDTGKAAETGTNVHDICEALARGETVRRVHPEYQPYVDRYKAFLDEYQPEFLFIEDTIWNEEHGYAGLFDAIAKLDGRTVVLDLKTTRSGVHAEVALQLAAYARGDYILRLQEPADVADASAGVEYLKLPKIDGAAVVHLRPDESSITPIDIGDDVFDMFVTLMGVRRWEQDLSKRVLGGAIPFGVGVGE